MRFAGCECYWLDATDETVVSLRRYASETKCPNGAYHDASVEIGHGRWRARQLEGHDTTVQAGERMRARSNRHWPKTCSCGYRFADDDVWQTNATRLYRRADGELVAIRGWSRPDDLAGALYDAWWLHDWPSEDGRGHVGADGVALTAVCPNGGHWHIDGPATGGGRWTRSGDPRDPRTLTASPSIAIGIQTEPTAYHGFLQAGRFTDDLGS